jgi:hypothetical protein
VISATWLGGPKDGLEVEIPDGGRSIQFAERRGISAFTAQSEEPNEVDVIVYRAPIRLTPNGWRILWFEKEVVG